MIDALDSFSDQFCVFSLNVGRVWGWKKGARGVGTFIDFWHLAPVLQCLLRNVTYQFTYQLHSKATRSSGDCSTICSGTV